MVLGGVWRYWRYTHACTYVLWIMERLQVLLWNTVSTLWILLLARLGILNM
jgi:hypothetical protein